MARIPLRFPTYHPQGFALVGDLIFLSSVEVTEAPVKYPQPVDGYDRSPARESVTYSCSTGRASC